MSTKTRDTGLNCVNNLFLKQDVVTCAALVFRDTFKLRLLSVGSYSTFEIQCVMVESTSTPLVCALVYRPPKSNKDFITGFLSHYITLHDRLLVLGDFNIHVCCQDKPMVKEFCHVLDSLGFMQHINQSTHVLGHTLDLILSHGLSIDNVNVEDAYLSDHKPIVFNVNISDPQCTAKTPDRYACYIDPCHC